MPEDRLTRVGRYGALKSWANTVDRAARTRPARSNSPGNVDYWLKRLPEKFADATEAQRLADTGLVRRAALDQ